ncbi:MAG: ABC transporter substrate-binding protein [Microbacterium sp.]|jgi:iron complex transport system substrate-binding protein|nr:ABC transporter substrate-binding protein [Microbacterium sp.]
MLIFTGCGATTAVPAESAAATGESAVPEQASLVPAGEGKTTYPLALESTWGTTELAVQPQRIAAVTPSSDDAEILAALGVTPIIASEWATDVFLEEALTQPIPERFTTGDSQFPVEQIAKANPDLIITLGADVSEVYDKLSSIAPVLSTATDRGGEASVASDWEHNIRSLGEALDLQDKAQEVLDDERTFFEQFRAEHPELAGKTAAYLVYYGAESGLQYHSSPDGPATTVFSRMGFAENPNAAKFEYRQAVSPELLSLVDADVIVFSDNSDGNYAEITELPLFKNLEAAKDNHVMLIDNRAAEGEFIIDGVTSVGNLPWALARSGPLSSVWAAKQMAPALSATVQR